jgi:nitroreductase
MMERVKNPAGFLMKATSMKRPLLTALLLFPILTWAQGQELRTIKLNEPNKTRGLPVMEALPVRASVGDWSEKDVSLALVSDISRFGGGTPELKKELGAIDTGIVSQNISLFCAAAGMATRPRAKMNRDRIKELLALKDTQYAMLNHSIGCPKKAG